MEAPPESRFFVVATTMYGYLSRSRSWNNSFALRVGEVYEAIYVGNRYLEVVHPERRNRVLYLPLNSKWHWDRVTFAPPMPALAALFARF